MSGSARKEPAHSLNLAMFSRFFLASIFVLWACMPAPAQKFFPDDPLMFDQDNVISIGEPRRMRLSDYYDFLQHTFATPGDLSRRPAVNVNTLDEVPDSSWFQNRHGSFPMRVDDIVRGPNTSGGPSTDGRWTVIEGKTEGITPGFRIRDALGQVYVIKFDPPENPEMATSAEVISTKFFHAAGYNVPENYIVFFRRADLVVGGEAKVSVGMGPARQMTEPDMDRILSRVYKTPEGQYRAIASRLIDGRALGPFKYYGTRSDDPNDIVPHENRRELRGLSVISAWLNHDDSRAINSLDVVVSDNARNYIRHYLIDFGSTLGSGSVGAQKPRAGWEYIWQPSAVFRRMFTLGLWDSSWIRIKYPDLPSIGRFESKEFDPEEWKPEYPNPAFMNARPEDSYWGAKIVMAFTDESIKAVVGTGRFSDPKAEQYMTQALIERRDKIGRHYLNQVLSVDNLKLNEGRLEFEHLASRYGFAERPSQYTLSWFRFDNEKSTRVPLGPATSSAGPAVPIPPVLLADTSPYFGVEIWSGKQRLSVFIRRTPGLQIVGIER
jgi:hypothetical protein